MGMLWGFYFFIYWLGYEVSRETVTEFSLSPPPPPLRLKQSRNTEPVLTQVLSKSFIHGTVS